MRSIEFEAASASRAVRAVFGVALLASGAACDRGGQTSSPAAEPQLASVEPPASETDEGSTDVAPTPDDDASSEAETDDGEVAEGPTEGPPAPTDEGTVAPDSADKQPAPLPKVIHAKTNASCGKGAGVGQSLRDFDLPLIAAEGKRLSKRSLRGKVSLVNLWGTWCEPCKKELPEFARLYRHYRANGLAFVAIATDEDPAPVEAFAKSRKIAGRLAYDGEAYSKTYGERSFPFTFVVDRKGTIVAAYDGYKEECIGQLEADLRAALEAGR